MARYLPSYDGTAVAVLITVKGEERASQWLTIPQAEAELIALRRDAWRGSALPDQPFRNVCADLYLRNSHALEAALERAAVVREEFQPLAVSRAA